MHQTYDYKELKEIQQRILQGMRLQDTPNPVQTIAGFDLTFREKKAICVAVVLDYETFEVLEVQHTITDELMGYNPMLLAFREGPPIIETYKMLEHQPDVLLVDGNGALHPYKVGVASYVGVMVNKPCIGITKELFFGHLEEDRILVQNEQRGTALKTKEFARPIFVSPGHDISLQTAVEIVKKTVKGYKLPYPLHIAHKHIVKLKKQQIGPTENEKV